MKKKLLIILILLFQIIVIKAQNVAFTNRLGDGGINVKGDITFIANNILNREIGTTVLAEIPYNDGLDNGQFNMEYIDIDSDPNTFSSSSAILNLPDCSRVVYAGLYWAGIYPMDNWGSTQPRASSITDIKFMLPGDTNYRDIAGTIIFDNGLPNQRPYVCYLDVTDMLNELETSGVSVNGRYVAADIPAVRGQNPMGGSAGWTMVVIYENDTMSSKNISIFDGFSSLNNTGAVAPIAYSGFRTIPNGPVEASILVASLEGDQRINGDFFDIMNVFGNFVPQNTTNLNPVNNFFNSSITQYDVNYTNRNPASSNTLGFDVDLFTLTNVDNRFLDNNQTSANLRFRTNRDVYFPFLNALAVEVIEPKVQMVKTVEDAAGVPVPDGMGIGLGQELFYSIKFRNTGTDDAENTVIVDDLPDNIDFLTADLSPPPGVTYSFTPGGSSTDSGTLTFNIPDTMVEAGGAEYEIRFRVKVVSDCSELRNACANVVMNQAMATYTGKISGIVVNDDPSFSDIDACNLGTVGTSNFLIDTSGCTFEREEILCGTSLTLWAGSGFDSYSWINTDNPSVVLGTKQSLEVDSSGTYEVTKRVPSDAPDGCIDTKETIKVIDFAFGPNPFESLVDEIIEKPCPSNNTPVAVLYLCGNNDRTINLPFTAPPSGTGGTTVKWFRLDTCPNPVTDPCPNIDSACKWTSIGTDLSQTFNDEGKYKVEVLYDGRCPKTYYLNVYKFSLDPNIVKDDIICGKPGKIVVNNVPVGYEYKLIDQDGVDTGFQESNTFPITKSGDYELKIRKKVGGFIVKCPFPKINIQDKKIKLDLTQPNMLCAGEEAKIRAHVLEVPGDYTYTLKLGTSTIETKGPTDINDETFEVTNEGKYTVEVTTPSCTISDTITVKKPEGLSLEAIVTKNISCKDGSSDGLIELNAGGGTVTPDRGYSYTVWSIDGIRMPTAYFTNPTYNVVNGQEGEYVFLVIDANNCTETSEKVPIKVEKELEFDHTATNITCEELGSINVSVKDNNLDYSHIEYSINGAAGPWRPDGSFTGLTKGTYTVSIRASKTPPTPYHCEYEITGIEITEPPVFKDGSVVATDYKCGPRVPILGTLTFTDPEGGTPPYRFYYKLSTDPDFTEVTGNTVANLVAGTYNTKVEDSGGCKIDFDDKTIDPLPEEPTFSSAVTYNCDGTGIITVEPLDASYTYTLKSTPEVTQIGDNTFPNVSSGTYTVTVDYGSDCTVDVNNITVLDNQEFTATVTNQTNPVCITDANGTIEVTASFPSTVPTDFEYSLDGGGTWAASGANPFSIPNLTDGVHNIIVRPIGSTTDCNIPLNSVTLSDPPAIEVAARVSKEITCDADPTLDGATISITSTTKGGNGAPYTYELYDNPTATGTPVQVGAPFTDIDTAGDYWVVAKDKEDCRSEPVPVTVPVRETIAFTAVPQCYDGANGVIDITITSGNGTYEYSSDGTTWQTPTSADATSFSIDGLSNKAYTVHIRDKKGCTHTENVTINDVFVATATPTNASCVPIGAPTGQIEVSTDGGSTTGHQYSAVIDGSAAGPFSATHPITNLAAGTYDVYVKDDTNCEFKIEDVVIEQIPPVAITIKGKQPTCNGDKGSIDGEINTGTGQQPYTITIANSGGVITTETLTDFIGTNFSFNNLPAEIYTVTITDDLGCTDSKTVTLTDPPAIVMDIEGVLPPNCAIDSSQTGFNFINIDPNDYLPNTLQYSIDNGANWVNFTATGGQIRDLNSGDKVQPVLQTIDSSGDTLCLVAYGEYEIIHNVTGLIVDPIANPGNCAVGFSVTVEALGGSPSSTFEFAINTPTGWVEPDTLNNGTLLDPDRTFTFTGLTSGLTYEFFVRDTTTGCIQQNNEDLYSDYTPSVPITSLVNKQSCFGSDTGQITFSISNPNLDLSNNFTWTLYKRDPVTNLGAPVSAAYTNVSQTGLADIIVTGLAAGNYYIVLTNDIGTCDFGSTDVLINVGTEITGTLNPVRDITCNEEGVVRIENVNGGFGEYTYEVTSITNTTLVPPISIAAGLTTFNVAHKDVINPALPVNITIGVTDINGCTTTLTPNPVVLNVSDLPTISLDDVSTCGVNKTITVSATGGLPPYQYAINGGDFSSSTAIPFETGILAAGSYDITVRDTNGCTDVLNDTVIHESIAFDAVVTLNAVCIEDGQVTLTINSGSHLTGGVTADYSYILGTNSPVSFGAGNTTTVLDLPPGAYNVSIVDNNTTCETLPKPVKVVIPAQPVFTTSVKNATCNGSANGSIGVSVTEGVTPYTYDIVQTAGLGLSAGQATRDPASNSFINVPAGTYTVTVTGDNGCATDKSGIVVQDNPLLTVTAPVAVQFACAANTNNVQNATLSINALDGSGVSGGSKVYSTVKLYHDVLKDNPTDNTTNRADDVEVTMVTVTGTNYEFSITDVAGGSYYVEVVDDVDCMSLSASTTIDTFDAITDITITQAKAIDCTTGDDITVKTLTDIANVTYSIISAPAEYAGSTTETVVLATESASFTNLPTGNYEITATTHPVTGCVFTKGYTVGSAPLYGVVVNNIKRACYGSTGSVDLSFNPSYNDVYSYEVFTAIGNTSVKTGTGDGNVTTPIDTLTAGEYYIEVTMTNTPFCSITSANFTIEEPTDDLTLSADLTYLKCNVIDSGEVELTANGGWDRYEYELVYTTTNVTIQNFDHNNVITGLKAGNYQATVRDANNCTEVINFQLDPATPITGSYTVTPNKCIGEFTASIEAINIEGGQLQDPDLHLKYRYALEYPSGTRTTTQTSPVFDKLPEGKGYSIIVSDGYSCDLTLGGVDIVDPTKTVASGNILEAITCTRTQATVEISGSGGTGPYQFSADGINFSGPNSGPNYRAQVLAGEHQFFVRDTELCVSEPVRISVAEYIKLTATLDTSSAYITCNGNANAVLSANAENGLGNYEYQLLDGSDTPIDGTWQTSNSFSNLDKGTYKINVRSTNAAGDVCSVITSEHFIDEPTPLVGNVVITEQVTCFGASTGIITATASGGNGGYEYNIVSDPSTPEYPAIKFTKNGVFNNLAAGVYWVTVKDEVGCINDPVRVEIDEPDELEISLVSVTEQACLSSPSPTITVDVLGGTAPYYISINGIELPTSYAAGNIILGATEGIVANTTYLISVRDSVTGCDSKAISSLTTAAPVDLELAVTFKYTCPTGNIIKAIVADKYKSNVLYSLHQAGTLIATNTTGEFTDVPAGNNYTVTATDTPSSCSENSTSDPINIVDVKALTMTVDDSQKNKLIANVNFGVPPYNFTVDGVDYGEENEFLVLETKEYTITVTDARGCEVTMVVNGVYITIKVINLFTPDGDGVNDYWYPLEVESYHDLEVIIFDRYTREIAKFRGMQQGWDGKYQGKLLPAGDYWYTIYYNELSGDQKKLMGHFTLYR